MKSLSTSISLFHVTGSIEPKELSGKGLTEFESFAVLQTILHKPTAYFKEVQQELFDITGTWVHLSTTCRAIKQRGFSRKKVQTIALQQSETKKNSVHVRNFCI